MPTAMTMNAAVRTADRGVRTENHVVGENGIYSSMKNADDKRMYRMELYGNLPILSFLGMSRLMNLKALLITHSRYTKANLLKMFVL